MLHLACPIPRDIVVACSGGPDSMSLLSFCLNGRKNITAVYINHRTAHANEAQKIVSSYCSKNNIKLDIHYVPENTEHNELAWRNARLDIYRTYTQTGLTVATGHHIDDLIEWYLLSAIHGDAKLMKPVDKTYKLIKPFLLNEKHDLINWCGRYSVPFIIDPTNNGNGNARANLRANVIPHLLYIHPGMYSSIRKKLVSHIRLMDILK